MKVHILALALATAIPSVALAQSSTVSGAAGGAATGAIVGGPVGAAVGGVAGAAIGTVIDPPPAEVREYVVRERAPSVAIEREVIVGEPLPETVELRTVPDYEYRYAVVNDRRVIVEPGTRRVVQVID